MAGWSISRAPKALRYRAWCAAVTTAWRMPAALPRTQSSLVALTMSRIVAMPRPRSPTGQATACWYSTSEEALEVFPSLSLSRWMNMAFLLPSGSTLGSRKQLRPSAACASTRNRSHIGAEQNHLWPVSR